MLKKILITGLLMVVVLSVSSGADAADFKPGLVGTYFNSRDFSDADKRVDILPDVDREWAKSRGSDWSA